MHHRVGRDDGVGDGLVSDVPTGVGVPVISREVAASDVETQAMPGEEDVQRYEQDKRHMACDLHGCVEGRGCVAEYVSAGLSLSLIHGTHAVGLRKKQDSGLIASRPTP